MDILHDYQAKRTIDEVYERVQRLFAGQPDLLEEFRDFLPENPNAQTNDALKRSLAAVPGKQKMKKKIDKVNDLVKIVVI